MGKDRQYTINGVTRYLSDWCKQYGQDFKLIYNRLRNGRVENLEEYLTENRKRDKRRLYYHCGKFKSIHQIAKEEGINYLTLKNNIKRMGYNKALLADYGPKLYSVNGKLMTVKQLSEAYDVKYHTLLDRLKKGWNLKDALTTKIEYAEIGLEKDKDFKQYKDTGYYVSKRGEVFNSKTRKFLRATGEFTDGILIVGLSIDGITKGYMLKNLVAELFIENPNNYISIGYRDGDKSNCSVENLFWGPSKVVRKNNSRKKPVVLISKNKGVIIRKFDSYQDACKYFNVTENTIIKYIRNKKVLNDKFLLVRKKDYNKYLEPDFFKGR